MDERNNHFDFDFTPIGQAIKKAREARGMTREQLSGIIGYAPRHIQSIENEGQYPSIELFIQMIKFLSHKHTSTSLASLYWKAGERTNLQKGTKISVPLFLMIRLSSLNHFKMLQRILYGFHFLCCRMLPRLFQFLYRIRSIVHWQA